MKLRVALKILKAVDIGSRCQYSREQIQKAERTFDRVWQRTMAFSEQFRDCIGVANIAKKSKYPAAAFRLLMETPEEKGYGDSSRNPFRKKSEQ